jgi:DnaJ-domain-containing protein 1
MQLRGARSGENGRMAQRPWERLRSRKRTDGNAPPPREPAKEKESPSVDLGGDEHAWWAQHDVETAYVKPTKRRTTTEQPTKRDTFSEYFSTESLFTTDAPREKPSSEANDDDLGPFSADDPYVILGIPASASWDDITIAHRRLAKLHHPDRLLNATSADRTRSEQRMRDINIAYSELRRRRGK